MHLVVLDDDLEVKLAEVIPVDELTTGLARLDDGVWVGVDAPSEQEVPRHLDDTELPPKFRTARCGEIGLARGRGYWVPWTTPPLGEPCPAWMVTGFAVWEALRRNGSVCLEVYPYAAFRTLVGVSPLAKKQTPSGLAQRAQLLRSAGLPAGDLESWSHDALDAAVAALVAWSARSGRGDRAACAAHPDGAIWLPPRLPGS